MVSPLLNGNWVDFLILSVIFFYILEGLKRGFIQGIFDVFGFILSLLLALRFYPFSAKFFVLNFSFPHGISNVLGFMVIAFAVETVFFMLENFILQFVDEKELNSPLNKILGFIPSVLSALVLFAFVFTALLSLPIKPNIKQDITNSRIGGFLTSQTEDLERSLFSVFGDAFNETLNFLTVKSNSGENVDLNFKIKDVKVDDYSEMKMLELVNQERKKRGFSLLKSDSSLRDLARIHCRDMFARGYFSHYTPDGLSPFDRMKQAGITYEAAGENLAYAPTVEIADTGLMNSPGHRANILSKDFGHVGIGVMDGNIYGKMFCQEFTN